MSELEPVPVDEQRGGTVEIRGGDRPEDYIDDPYLAAAWGGELGGIYGALAAPDEDTV